jgi:hypothetical protein
MNFLVKLLQGFAYVPAVVHGVEALFGKGAGTSKKDAAVDLVGSALGLSEAVANREIVDEDKFRDGLSKTIDGVVQCLNASAWAKAQ